MEARDKINLHSEELQEVLGTPPGWLVRWGTTIAFFALCALFGVAYFVKYPDIIEAPIVITAPNPSVNLIAERSGLLEVVMVADNEEVDQEDLLLVYSTAANMLDIDSLEADLQYFSGELSIDDLENFTPRRNLVLGELQEEYAEFVKNFDAFRLGELSDNDKNTIKGLQDQINQIQQSIAEMDKRRQEIVQRDSTAAQNFKRLKKKYLSEAEQYGELYIQSVQALNDVKKEYRDFESELTSKKLEIGFRQRDIEEVRQQSGAVNTSLILKITENIDRLKGRINGWRTKNLVYAPIGGRVVFYQEFDNENQTVETGTKILKIIPPGEVGEIYGKVDLPQFGSGNVEATQNVVIKIDNYPHYEYGILKGIVKSKSDVAQENNTYKVEVELPNNLVTSKNIELNFTQGMQGSAEIITKEKRFLYRIFENVFDF